LSPPRAVNVTAPCRADLAGGTLDIWPVGLLHPGSMTVNAAIPVMVELELRLGGPDGLVDHIGSDGQTHTLSPEHALTDLTAAVAFALMPAGGATVRVRSQAHIGSGLGGSSAYAVALARGLEAVTGSQWRDDALVTLLRDLEARLMSAPTGVQDHWPAICGGVLALHLAPGADVVETLEVKPEWMGDRMTVFDTGVAHHSGMVNWQVIRRRLDGDAETRRRIAVIADAARKCRQALLAVDEAAVGEAIAAEWAARRELAPEVCPPELEAVSAAATEAGATAVKACGAGGGGSLVVWHAAGARPAVIEALEAAAPRGRVVATDVATDGCRVTVVE
jgi:D-glycero-alpha-D-manno-heptose-7-phosphate kinase